MPKKLPKWTLLLLVVVALIASIGVLFKLLKKDDTAKIPNFLWVDAQVCTGGQPTLDALARLQRQGVRAVINLRRPDEPGALAEEAAYATQLGLRYFNIPIDPNAPQDAQVEEFLQVMADPANRPAFIHCTVGSRVGALWMIRRVLVDGWSVEAAEAEAKRIGLRNPRTRNFARDYLRRHRQPQPQPLSHRSEVLRA